MSYNFHILTILILTTTQPTKSSSYDQTSKIEIIGKPITIKDFMDDWNYFVRIECPKICGGVLINPKWVLTTAECIQTHQKCIVKMGSIYLDDINGDESIKIASSKTIIHPNFKNDSENSLKLYNIGLIQLVTKVRLSRKINVASVTEEIPSNTEGCVAISWSGDIFPISLYQVELKTSRFKDCKTLTQASKNEMFVCDLFGITTSENDTGLTSKLHIGAALMCKHDFYGFLSASGYNLDDTYFLIWSYLLGSIDWINQKLRENGDKPIILLRSNLEEIEIKTVVVTKKKLTTPTTESRIIENYDEENNFFENEHIDPYEIYLNQTHGKRRKVRRYNPRFRRLNTILRKADNGWISYDDDIEEFDIEDSQKITKRKRPSRKKKLTTKMEVTTDNGEEDEEDEDNEGTARNKKEVHEHDMMENTRSKKYFDNTDGKGIRIMSSLYRTIFWSFLTLLFSNYFENT